MALKFLKTCSSFIQINARKLDYLLQITSRAQGVQSQLQCFESTVRGWSVIPVQFEHS